jgi:hypothetical protein
MTHLSSPRRRFQFRLRTLIIGVTLLAVVCWGIVDRQQLIRERDKATQREGEANAAMIKADESLRIYIEAFSRSEARQRELEAQLQAMRREPQPQH